MSEPLIFVKLRWIPLTWASQCKGNGQTLFIVGKCSLPLFWAVISVFQELTTF